MRICGSCSLSPDSIHRISVTDSAPVFLVVPKACAEDKQDYSGDKEPEQHCYPFCCACASGSRGQPGGQHTGLSIRKLRRRRVTHKG
jgi:hypothetical protein